MTEEMGDGRLQHRAKRPTCVLRDEVHLNAMRCRLLRSNEAAYSVTSNVNEAWREGLARVIVVQAEAVVRVVAHDFEVAARQVEPLAAGAHPTVDVALGLAGGVVRVGLANLRPAVGCLGGRGAAP